ncbi:MAG: adenosylcobalamin-dependent ribonucleoside-diphosphate reductase [Patescibacteria group bacterium]
MGPTDSKFIQSVKLGEKKGTEFVYNENGLRFQRVFSEEGKNAFDMVEYERRSSIIREPDGTVVFEMKDLEIPKDWSQVATDIIAQKYFRKTGVPQYGADGLIKRNSDGSPMLGSETSAKETVHRLAGTWRYWGEKYGYFASAEDAQIFYDEIVVMLLRQMAAPNSPQWFNTGLFWAYGINSTAQGHYYVDPDNGVMTKAKDAYSHPQPHACGRYDTKLFTDRGILDLGEVVEENLTNAKVFDGSGFVKILAVKNNGVRKLFRATLKNGNYIEFTDDHLIWSAPENSDEYDWVELKNTLGCKVKFVILSSNNDGAQEISEQKVISIDYIGEEEVYDIQTESGQFCANGVVVHNCFIQSVKDDLVGDGGIMDLWVREARLFKYGSGTGTNFSGLRGCGEPLSGGGRSSGLMSWLKIGDRSAGAIKSGGTTRRAAKMVILNLDHPDIEEFIDWKVKEEKKVAALITAGYTSDYEGEAYQTVSGQNSNNSVRVANKFMEALENNGTWNLTWRTDGTVCKTLKATDLWDKIAYAAWACADPGVQFDDNVNEWHTCPESGRINGSNPCSEYMFLDNTACNLASMNLAKFFDPASLAFDVAGFKHATRAWTTVLEISVLMAQFPSKEIAQMSYEFRTLGLGYANVGSVLMMAGIPYESEEACAYTAAVTALMTAESYKTSAEMAKFIGPFLRYELNKKDMLRVIRNHRRAAFNAKEEEYEKMAIRPKGISPEYAPAYLLAAARESWNEALAMGESYGYRNAQTTLLAPTGTIGLLMDCATTGVEPDFALVKFKKLAGGGYFKIVNEAVPAALRNLNYSESEIKDIFDYMKGTADITNAPFVNAATLKTKGFNDADVMSANKALLSAFEIKFAFNAWTLGEDCMKRVGFSQQEYNDPNFNMLRALGFADEQIETANEFVCGTMTVEGAPHLKKEHYPVFDCANKCGRKGRRFIHWLGHVRMMGAAQAFLSGAISKTINMPNEATLEDVKKAYLESWKSGLKAVALYRDGSKLSQPLSTSSKNKGDKDKKEDEEKVETMAVVKEEITTIGVADLTKAIEKAGEMLGAHFPDSHALESYSRDGSVKEHRIYLHGEKRKVPAKRSGITVSAKIGNQQIWLRTGEYPDGKLAEIFIDMYKEGAGFRSVLNMFAISVSMGLQYGVPLEKFVENFTFTRFEPSGMTDHPNVKICTSVIDFVFRVLGMEYLGRTDFVQVPPKGIQKNRFEQMSRLAESVKQNALDLNPVAEKPEALIQATAAEAQDSLPLGGDIMEAIEAVDSMDAALSSMMGDAPACPTCGHVTVRNGACYKCLNCGDSLGCS